MMNDSGADNSDQGDEEAHCPVCRSHTEADNLAAQGLILSGVKALFAGDMATISSVSEVLTAYDGHVAIGFAAALLNDICAMAGMTPDQFLDAYREGLNHAQAHGL